MAAEEQEPGDGKADRFASLTIIYFSPPRRVTDGVLGSFFFFVASAAK